MSESENQFNWFWGEELNEVQGYVRYEYGRRHFLAETDNETALVGLTWPEDVSEGEENKLAFNNITYYETPVFEAKGKYVIRLPPREMMYQYYREARGRSDKHPSISVKDSTTYS